MRLAVKPALMSLICYLSHGKWSFKNAYNTIYEGQNRSSVFREIVKEVFKDEFPEKTDTFSFVTKSDLNRVSELFNDFKNELIADLACGRGGPGMCVAEKTGADLVGIDISDIAVKSAKKKAAEFNLGKADFLTGSFYETGLESESVKGAMSIDAFWVVTDRRKALNEIKRILKPGGLFVFTTWDGNIPFMPSDHRKDLEDSGFDIEIYEETKGWKERQLAVYKMGLEKKELLIKEMGKEYAMPILKEAKGTPPVLEKSTRVFIAARKI